jgi:hypothetical protein
MWMGLREPTERFFVEPKSKFVTNGMVKNAVLERVKLSRATGGLEYIQPIPTAST